MGKEILTFGDIEIEKKNFYCLKTPILVSNKISLGEKTINTLLVTFIMIIKLSHYM